MSASGENNSRPAAVLRGALDVLREDFWGNQTILARLGAGDVFAEVFACLPDVQVDVSVCAVQPTFCVPTGCCMAVRPPATGGRVGIS